VKRCIRDEDLRQNEDLFAAIVDQAPMGVYVVDDQFRLQQVNSKAMPAFQSIHPLIGRDFAEVMHVLWGNELGAQLSDIFRHTLRTGEGYVSPPFTRLRADLGVEKSYEWETKRVTLPTGEHGVVCYFTDTTERTQLEKKLHDAQARLQTTLAATEIGTWIWDIQNDRVLADANLQRMFSVNAAEAAGGSLQRYVEAIFPDDRDRVGEAIQEALQSASGIYEADYRLVQSDGSVSWVTARGKVERSPEGTPVRFPGVVIDITKRKQAEAERQKFVSFADQSSEFIGMCDLDLNPYYLNAAGLHTVGLDHLDEALRTPVGEFFFPEDRPFLVNEFFPAVRRDGSARVEVRFRHFKTGEAIWMLYSVFFLRDAYDKPVAFATVSQNIMERKRAEMALRESERRFRDMADNAPVMVWVTEPDGSCSYLSQSWYRFTGQTPAEGLGFGWVDATHPDDRKRAHDAFVRANSEKSPFRVEYRLRRHDGVYHWAIDAAVPRRGKEGEFLGYVGSVLNINDQKGAQEALRMSEARFRAAAGAVSSLIWTNDADGKMTGEQPGWSNFTGQTAPEYEGYGWAAAVHPEDAQPSIEAWNRAVAERRTFEFEHRVRRRDGEWRLCSIRAVPVFSDDGALREWVGVHTDITERKRAEEKLAEANEVIASRAGHLEKVVEERTAALRETIEELEGFSYSISHDMRAPLRAMQSFAQILDEECSEALGAQGREYVRRIVTSADRMDRLIRDVLDYSRIARAELPRENVDLAALLNGILEGYPQFQSPKAEINVIFPLPRVYGNTAALTQCLSNLIDNAVKFVAPGVVPKVRIWAELRGGRVHLFVQDNGIGIDPRVHSKVFDIFYRLGRDFEGTGIGLAVVKRAAQRMGGRISLKSAPGEGSTFEVDLESATWK
jgi:PAS domain S-box-containing protein